MSSKPYPATLRAIKFVGNKTDLPFLRELYASTRLEEVAQTGWPQEQADAFLLQQFEAQHKFYTEQFTDASFEVIIDKNRTPIGRIYLEEREDEFRIIDISLLPSHRGKGIGGRLVQNIINNAAGKAVRIHVEHNNPAMRLYNRLGFVMVEDKGIYHLMELTPPRPGEE